MLEPKHRPATDQLDEQAARDIHPDMPNYVDDEAAFLAAVDAGLADLEAGRTVSAEAVAARYRRTDRPV